MKRFFETGMAFMVVALLCFLAAIVSEKGTAFIGVGTFWLIMAVIVRAKNSKKPTTHEDEG